MALWLYVPQEKKPMQELSVFKLTLLTLYLVHKRFSRGTLSWAVGACNLRETRAREEPLAPEAVAPFLACIKPAVNPSSTHLT